MPNSIKTVINPAGKSGNGNNFVDAARFLGRWARNPLQTGAVAPSGKHLAQLMASYVDVNGTGPIVELGPGTGPVTSALLRHGVAPERLFLLEYSSEFCDLLRKRFPGVTVIQGDA